MMSYRYFLHLSFDGRNYHGWQIQDNAVTVQGVLEKALSLRLGHNINVVGCGRTDTGVHARSYYAHFDSLEDNLDAVERQFSYQLNRQLPSDISINKVSKVKRKAHARFDAFSRTYQYILHKSKDPFLVGRSLYIYNALDLRSMQVASKHLMGSRNFSSFAKSASGDESVCTVNKVNWEEQELQIFFRITANRFLRGMVRSIVGTLLDVGTGKLSPADFKSIIEKKERTYAGQSVSAHGLYLVDVKYDPELFLR